MIFDIIIILMLLMFTVVGLKQGIIKTGVSLIGIILVFIISFLLKGLIGNILCLYLPFFSFNGLTSLNILIYQTIGFIIIFTLLLSVYALIIKLSKALDLAVNLTIVLIIPSKILGAILGFIEGYIIVFLLLITLMIPLHNVDIFTSSKLVNHIVYKSPIITKYTSPITDTIKDSIYLEEEINNKKISIKTGNKKILNSMIKHKVVKKEIVNKLIENNKLKM